jgi:NodT family efflux transporter outer membrane factor (OMF) lipoprotein
VTPHGLFEKSDAKFAGPKFTMAAFLAFSVAGCAVGPDFIPPDAPVADHYLESRTSAIKTNRQVQQNWWRVFRDPTLNRLTAIAYNQNLTLLTAGTRVLAARAQLGVMIGDFYPQQQQAAGGLTYNNPSHADIAANPQASLANYWQSALGLRATWELDFWGRFRRGVEAADAAYLASIASYDAVLVTLVGDVASTYIGIRTLEKQIGIAKDNVVKQQKALVIARERFTGGAATELDIYQAENVLGATEATVPQLTIQLRQGQNALRVLLGMAPKPLGGLLARGSGRIPSTPGKAFLGGPADLLRRRPDIRAAELRVAAQSAEVGVAEADLYPALSLTGRWGGTASTLNGSDLGKMWRPAGLTYSLGPTLQWNILNYGQITNNVRFEDATLQQYITEYQNTVLKAQQEVENGVAVFVLSQVQAKHLRDSVTAAKGALDISLIQYKLGTRDFTAVLTSEQNLYQAENSLAVAEGNIAQGLTSIYRALGGGWQIREKKNGEFVPPVINAQMRARTNWGDVLPPANEPQPPTPGLPGPEDRGPTVRPPEW